MLNRSSGAMVLAGVLLVAAAASAAGAQRLQPKDILLEAKKARSITAESAEVMKARTDNRLPEKYAATLLEEAAQELQVSRQSLSEGGAEDVARMIGDGSEFDARDEAALRSASQRLKDYENSHE